MNLVIRPLSASADFQACEEVQRRAWDTPDLGVVPDHLLRAVAKYRAGFLLGAFVDDLLVGFILALETRDHRVHHSHMMGIRPEWQSGRGGLSVGLELKKRHREEALRQGVEIIQWTFDPLVGRNANLNLRKLRTKIVHYDPDAYGSAEAVGINAGLPTDRVLVRWYLKEDRPAPITAQAALALPLAASPEEIPEEAFRLAIPFDLEALKAQDPAQAMAARLRVRAVFQAGLAKGFGVEEFLALPERRESFYVFTPSRSDRRS